MATDEIGFLAARLGVLREVVVAVVGEHPSAPEREALRRLLTREQKMREDVARLLRCFSQALSGGGLDNECGRRRGNQ